MIQLSININKIALIRNSREGNNPDLCDYAKRCIDYGAQGITVHPRPDQRHIRAQDCLELKQAMAGTEFNIEGNPMAKACPSTRPDVSDYPGFLEIVKACKPDQCTLVPDSDTQLTSDHGFDLIHSDTGELKEIISDIQSQGTRVSLFMDADLQQIEQAKAIGADRIELYTGPYAWAKNFQEAFTPYKKAALLAQELKLGINAGHDLNLKNLPTFSQLPGLEEVSIGHALTIDSLEMGLQACIQAYLTALS